MSESNRKVFTGAQKAKVAIEAVKGTKTINEIAQEHGVHPNQVSQWKKELMENAGNLFEGKRGPKAVNAQSDPDRLYAKIGQLNMELDWLKKSLESAFKRASELLRLLDEEYTRHPFYGSRRMKKYLSECGYSVNRKRVQRLMQKLGLVGMSPGPNTSKRHPQHKVYPYLLRGVDITQPNQVWSSDITYIRLPRGFVYLVAIIDWYSRKVLSWRLSNTLDAGFCVDCLEEAIMLYGTPVIFNSDQGSQFTSDVFTGVLLNNGITISMDGRGRAVDNIFVERLWRTVKYEEVYLKQHSNMPDLLMGLTRYFQFYNQERWHQALAYKTPDEVYKTAIGGGAKIVDKFREMGEASGHVPQNRDSAVQLECEQSSILN